uniref:Uncharacterized protein n=1 Tax=Oryza meridionalis TaxID=40149 RepID=A0A0E0CUV2_9ORYZ
MVETSTDLEGTLDQVSGIFSLWVDRAKWTVQGIPTRPRTSGIHLRREAPKGSNYRKGSCSAVEDPIVAAGNTAAVETLRNECKKGITCMLEEILAGQAEEIGEKVTWVTEQPLMDILATWHLLCNVKY